MTVTIGSLGIGTSDVAKVLYMTPNHNPICLIAARSKNGVIGFQGKMPWHIPEDLAFFRKMTLNKAVIMGRVTWESLGGKPLSQRQNIVLSHQAMTAPADVHVCCDLDAALCLAQRLVPDTDIMVMGGGAVYRAALPVAHRVILTELDLTVEGDTFFPELPDGWVISHCENISQRARVLHYKKNGR